MPSSLQRQNNFFSRISSSPGSTQYLYARYTVGATMSAAGDLTGFVTLNGNIVNNSGLFALKAGITYKLSHKVYLEGSSATSTSSYCVFKWVDSSNTPLETNSGSSILTPTTATAASWTNQPEGSIIFTPTQDMNVKVRAITIAGFTSIVIGTGNGSNGETSVTIEQVGASAITIFPGALYGKVCYGLSAAVGPLSTYTPVNLNTLVHSVGLTNFQSNSSGVVTLKPGYRYSLEGMLIHFNAITGGLAFRWKVNEVLSGTIGGSAVSSANTDINIGASSMARYDFDIPSTGSSVDVSLVLTGWSNLFVYNGNTSIPSSYMIITAHAL